MATRNKNKSSIGCLFWIALILLILVIFLFNKDTIQNVLDETGFVEFIQSNEKEPEIERVEPQPAEEPAEEPDNIQITEKPVEKDPPRQEEPKQEPEDEVIAIEVETQPETAEKPAAQPEKPQKVRRSSLYFVAIDDAGGISLKKVVRPVYYLDSPLTETLNNLLEGLSGAELNQGFISLIPEQTRLLSVAIKNGTAYLNFSEDFLFNSFGAEGKAAQLKQIVYTTTEFANVDSVQFLIEGAKTEYMGSEGIFIGNPLSRSSF